MTFFVRKRVAGRDERIKIGRFPEVTIEQARKRARVLKGEIAAGQDPTVKNKQLRQELTFSQLFELYMEHYSRPRKRSWRSDEREVKQYLAHWLSRRLSAITRNDVAVLHERMGRDNGPYQANRVLARISAMFNKAIDWGWQGTNPAHGIPKFPEKSRDRFRTDPTNCHGSSRQSTPNPIRPPVISSGFRS